MSATNPVGTFVPTNNTTQTGAAYKNQIDSNFAVAQRIIDAYAPRPAATPNMTVVVDPGNIFANGTLTEVASQTTPTFTAPSGNPRIDRVCVNTTTGALTVTAGTPASSPVPPAIPSGYFPCAQVLLTPSTTAIGASNIYDERPYGGSSSLSGPTLLLSGNPTNIASLTLNVSAFFALYHSFTIVLTGIAPDTANVNLRGSFIACGTHQWSYGSGTSSSATANANSNSDTGVTFMAGMNVSNENLGFLHMDLMLKVAPDASKWSRAFWNSTYINNSSNEQRITGSGNGSGGTQGIVFSMSSGNISTVTYRVYGNP